MIRLEKKIPPLVQLLIMFCLLPLFSDRSVFTMPNPIYLMLALTLMIVGLLFCFSAVYSFRLAQTTVDPMVPEKASELVQHGIFKISRNPMYIGFVLCSAALAMWLQAPLTLVFVLGFIWYLDRFQIQPEERALWLRFGNEYTNYQKKVRRWL